MKKHTRWLIGAVGFGVVSAMPAVAQSNAGSPIEIGIDGLIARRSTKFEIGNISSTSDQTVIQLPAAQVRVAFFLNDMIQLEPALGFQYVSTSGGHGSQTQFNVGLPINFQVDRSQPNWYVRPLVGLQHVTSTSSGNSTSNSATQVSFGAGLGVRVPIDRRFASRFEANYTHGNHNDNLGSFNQFGLLAGLSFFTR